MRSLVIIRITSPVFGLVGIGCWQELRGGALYAGDGGEPSGEIGVAGAGMSESAVAAFEISPPANRSARPSRDAAGMRPLLCSPARLECSRCLIKLCECPPPRRLCAGVAECWARARRGTVSLSPVGNIGAFVVFMSLIVACCAAFVKSSSKNFCMEHVKRIAEQSVSGSSEPLRARPQI